MDRRILEQIFLSSLEMKSVRLFYSSSAPTFSAVRRHFYLLSFCWLFTAATFFGSAPFLLTAHSLVPFFPETFSSLAATFLSRRKLFPCPKPYRNWEDFPLQGGGFHPTFSGLSPFFSWPTFSDSTAASPSSAPTTATFFGSTR